MGRVDGFKNSRKAANDANNNIDQTTFDLMTVDWRTMPVPQLELLYPQIRNISKRLAPQDYRLKTLNAIKAKIRRG